MAAGPTYTSGSLRSDWTTYSNGDFAAGQGVNLLDSTSNEWYLTGVQFEVGSQVTPFEHRSYGEELTLCQRYCYVTTGGGAGVGVGGGSNAVHRCQMNLPVTMRAAPSVTMNGSTMYTYDGANSAYFNGFQAVHSTNQAIDWETSSSELSS